MYDAQIKEEIKQLDSRELLNIFSFSLLTSLKNLKLSEEAFREKINLSFFPRISILGYENKHEKKSSIRNNLIHNGVDIYATNMAILRCALDENSISLHPDIPNLRGVLIGLIKDKFFKAQSGRYEYSLSNLENLLNFLLLNDSISNFDLVGILFPGKENKAKRKELYQYTRKSVLSKQKFKLTFSELLALSFVYPKLFFDGKPHKKDQLIKRTRMIEVKNLRNLSNEAINGLLNRIITNILDKSTSVNDFFTRLECFDISKFIALNYKAEIRTVPRYKLMRKRSSIRMNPKTKKLEVFNDKILEELGRYYLKNGADINSFIRYLKDIGVSDEFLNSQRTIIKQIENKSKKRKEKLELFIPEYQFLDNLISYYINKSNSASDFIQYMSHFDIDEEIFSKGFNKIKMVLNGQKNTFEQQMCITLLKELTKNLDDKNEEEFFEEFFRMILVSKTISPLELINIILKVKLNSSNILTQNELNRLNDHARTFLELVNNSLMFKHGGSISIQKSDCNKIVEKLIKYYVERANHEHKDLSAYLEPYSISKKTIIKLKTISNYELGGKALHCSLLSESEILDKYVGIGTYLAEPDDLTETIYNAYTELIFDLLCGKQIRPTDKEFLLGEKGRLQSLFKQIIRKEQDEEARNELIRTIEVMIKTGNLSNLRELILSRCDEWEVSLDYLKNIEDEVSSIRRLEDFCILNYLNSVKVDKTYSIDDEYNSTIKNAYILYRFLGFKEEVVGRNIHTEENVFDLSNVEAIECLLSFDINSLFKKGDYHKILQETGVEIIMKNYDSVSSNVKINELEAKLKLITIIRNSIAHADVKIDYEEGVLTFIKYGEEVQISIEGIYSLIDLYEKIKKKVNKQKIS